MTMEELQQQLARTEATVRLLQEELAETNRGLLAMTLELEQRVDEREAQLRSTRESLARSNAEVARTGETVHALQEELEETNRGLVALTLELEQRVDARTTELRQLTQKLEERVEERTTQLRQANANLQTFAHTAAHDLRAPLRAIKSFATLVEEDCGPKIDPDGRSMLQRIGLAANQMQRLLDDLLEYSKLGEAELKLEPVSLRQAVDDCLSLLEADIRSRQAVVKVESGLPDISGHPATVVLLINNFVANALKFVAPGVQPEVRIWAETRGAFVRVSVQDNGIGIPQESLARTFEVFQRFHGKSYPGTGLGLAIVRKGAERMGGRVGVESKPGQGSRFWVEFQAAGEPRH